MPSTFVVYSMSFGYQAFNGPRDDPDTLNCTSGNLYVSPTATVTVSAECGGEQLQSVILDLVITGMNGERTTVCYLFE